MRVVVNSAALKAAGITAATKDPVGGKIERDANGNPTGLLVDAAMDLVDAKVPPPTARADCDQALAKAQEHAARRRHHRRLPTWARRLDDWAAMQSARPDAAG